MPSSPPPKEVKGGGGFGWGFLFGLVLIAFAIFAFVTNNDDAPPASIPPAETAAP